MNTQRNNIPEARKLVIKFREMLGGRPVVEGLCQLNDSCDVCREARKSSPLYMAHVYTGWAIDNITSLCATASDSESRILQYTLPRQKDQLQALNDSFNESLKLHCEKVKIKIKEYELLKSSIGKPQEQKYECEN